MDKVTIRPAKISDIDAIMNIEENGFIPQIQEEKAVFLKRIENCPSLFLIFEADDDHSIMGYLSAEYMDSIPEFSDQLKLGHLPSSQKGKYIYISSFAILPQFRTKGTGKALWNKSLDFFGTDKDFLLLVNEEWKGARHIYECSGFTLHKTFKNFFPSEINSFSDGLLLVKIH